MHEQCHGKSFTRGGVGGGKHARIYFFVRLKRTRGKQHVRIYFFVCFRRIDHIHIPLALCWRIVRRVQLAAIRVAIKFWHPTLSQLRYLLSSEGE